MLEIPIQTDKAIPDRFEWLRERKRRAEVLSDRLISAGIEQGQRVSNCVNLLPIAVCSNGYQAIRRNKLRFCQVRGCPICEVQLHRRSMARIKKCVLFAEESRSRHEWISIVLPIDPVPVEEIRKSATHLFESVRRLLELKAVKIPSSIRLTSISYAMGQVLLSVEVVGFCSPGFFAGRYYLSKKNWQQLWKQSLRKESPPIQLFRFGQDSKKLMYHLCRNKHRVLDLESVPDEHLKGFFDQVTRIQMLHFRGDFLGLAPLKGSKERRHYYPSELRAINAAQKEWYGAVPNPFTDFDVDYLQYSDPWIEVDG